MYLWMQFFVLLNWNFLHCSSNSFAEARTRIFHTFLMNIRCSFFVSDASGSEIRDEFPVRTIADIIFSPWAWEATCFQPSLFLLLPGLVAWYPCSTKIEATSYFPMTDTPIKEQEKLKASSRHWGSCQSKSKITLWFVTSAGTFILRKLFRG